jgi:hypothetical protein
VLVTSNLPFEEWTSVFGAERLTGALLDRLTHHVHILELNGDSYRLKQSKGRRRKTPASADDEAPAPGDHRSRNRRDHFLKKAPKSERPLREGAFRFNRQPRYWTGFTPPRRPEIAPPLTPRCRRRRHAPNSIRKKWRQHFYRCSHGCPVRLDPEIRLSSSSRRHASTLTS